MWIIAIVVSLVIGLLIQGIILPNDSGLILAVFTAVIIMGGFIMYQLRKIHKSQEYIIVYLNNTKDHTQSN